MKCVIYELLTHSSTEVGVSPCGRVSGSVPWVALCQGPVSTGALRAGRSTGPAGRRFCSLEFEMGTSVVWEMSGLSQMPDRAGWVCIRGMGAAKTIQWVYSTCICAHSVACFYINGDTTPLCDQTYFICLFRFSGTFFNEPEIFTW